MEGKTELLLIPQERSTHNLLIFNNQILKYKKQMNAFDSKINWQIQIANTASESKRALHAIYLIRNHFRKEELLQLITANYYSILWYNLEILHVPSLSQKSKQMFMSTSAAPLELYIPIMIMEFTTYPSIQSAKEQPQCKWWNIKWQYNSTHFLIKKHIAWTGWLYSLIKTLTAELPKQTFEIPVILKLVKTSYQTDSPH